MTISLVLAVFGALFLLVFQPTRALLVWLFGVVCGPVLTGLKHVLHIIVRAHANVARNFLPRARIFFELSRKRTSHTGE